MKLLSVLGSLLCASIAFAGPVVEKRIPGQGFENPELNARAQSYFLNQKSKAFAVEGKKFPGLDFDIGESYAGLLPITDDPKEKRKLFFWFFPAAQKDIPHEVTIWLNGGPGCSSLIGLLSENGPFLWPSGMQTPIKNSYSWTNLTNMLWVEQPVGVGYAPGLPTITDEEGLAKQFLGFYKNFLDVFQLYNWKTYLTGESYAGMFVPYIAHAILSSEDKKHFNLGGISINNPVIGEDALQEQVPIMAYANHYNNILFYNDTFLQQQERLHKECGYTDYYNKYFKFPPPKGPFPAVRDPYDVTPDGKCDIQGHFFSASQITNPCFSVYHITEMCPFASSQLGPMDTGYEPQPGAQVYFDRADVKKALHVDPKTTWTMCSAEGVFSDGNGSYGYDQSYPPGVNGILKSVIEATNNVLIGNGDLDMLIPTNGTLLAIQNMTWNGVQGFSKYPNRPLFIPGYNDQHAYSVAGNYLQGYWIKERGLLFYSARLAGHPLPGSTKSVGFRQLQVLLGHIKDFDSQDKFPEPQFGGAPCNDKPASAPAQKSRMQNQVDRLRLSRKPSAGFKKHEL
ncbi:Serine carboxypeptidase [Pyrenophora tritici-repentis]|uniref:Carboxypeptidase n=1 Tax=Pyrenophora tritici-repentis (strain Pt-1C-BFP) TaxID=426418 RepID=B2VVE2_PYRTR|nr:carboxypeptidase cpdS precursor [Pyrenophora tritici-repentis Pt-1C-BFP]KAA8626943.1 Serine carboxypeptidase [Pyrenophora tritici-repentis]EDU41695.1 carboxypeptidase cpdS precursor [Pyrenophora tritici-repentis Pt-1C-BFP]KAF7455435.1 Serine carboxypeptidase [Pyrenophora tritici-repentis]KAI0575434.1 Serine carboxypeptidase [Pyrenophora tritici-repentis]KAI0583168.1 Serine carboxypeptidase [Pyrenophora tritici-repentis]